LRSHCGGQRFAFNWGLALVRANPGQRQASANRRLLGVQRLSHDPARGAELFSAVNDPIVTDDGKRIPGLRFTDPRVHALLGALLAFRLLPHGFSNA
jgi:hypothetical protein